MTLYSEPGHGTTVRLYLPRVEAEEESAEAVPIAAPLDTYRGHGETVLVVEDEPRVRRTSVARLKSLGYRVLEAANGPAALAVLETHPEVDVLFTDMVMPGGMTGADLATRVRALWPDVRVLFTSGYAEPDVVRQGQVDGARWLKKPHTAVELARTLRTVIVKAATS